MIRFSHSSNINLCVTSQSGVSESVNTFPMFRVHGNVGTERHSQLFLTQIAAELKFKQLMTEHPNAVLFIDKINQIYSSTRYMEDKRSGKISNASIFSNSTDSSRSI